MARPDRAWARWIGQQLRRAGHEVELDEWSWQAGTSFLANMDEALARAERVVAVVSPAYLDPNSYGREEREAALQRAHGNDGLLIPVVVDTVVLPPLLARLSHVDLTGLDERRARARLVEAVAGRRPPDLAVDMPYPGAATAAAADIELLGQLELDVAFPGVGGRTSLDVVHLSDLRFGAVAGAAGAGPGSAGTLVSEVAEQVREVGLEPDLVVVTGDLTEHGLPSEFAQAAEFLAELVGAWGLPRQRVAVVPGDRDVNHLACQAYFLTCQANQTTPVAPYFPKWEHFLRMLGEFYGDGEAARSFEVGREWSLFAMDGVNVVVAGFNSTMVVSHLPENGYGMLGAEQRGWFAGKLRDYYRLGWLRIGAVHHRPTHLADADDDTGLRDAAEFAAVVGPHLNLVVHGGDPVDDGGGVAELGELDVTVLAAGECGEGAGSGSAGGPARGGWRYQLLRLDATGLVRHAPGLPGTHEGGLPGTHEGGVAGGEPVPGLRLDRAWRKASATLRQAAVSQAPAGVACDADAAAPAAVTEGEPPLAGDGEFGRPDRELGGGDERADLVGAVVREDTFLARVREVARLRNPGATVTVVDGGGGVPAYLRVAVVRPGLLVEQRPVGVCEHGVDAAAVELFADRVHARYAAGDPHLVSELVYGGPRAGDALAAAALRRGVRLVSFVEYQGLLDLRDYLARQSTRLAADPLYPPGLYVPQRITRLDQPGAPPVDDALAEVARWLTRDGPRFVLLLADFGHGKTFLLHELARRLPECLPHLVPVLVELRTLEKAHAVDELLSAHFMAAGEDSYDRVRFGYLRRAGRVVLLFDGFDELALRVSYERAADHLHTLLAAVDGDAKMVVTSRRQHFLDDDQVRTALGRRVELVPASRLARLEDFTDDQIRAFLVNLFDGQLAGAVNDALQRREAAEQAAGDRLALIRDIKDLLGLSRNPRMLGFIAALDEQRLRDVQARKGSIGSADLYQELLDKWLLGEERRTQPGGAAPTLTASQRWEAVTALALRLWASTERLVSLAELAGTTAATLTTLAEQGLDAEEATHLIGSGSLLVRADGGGFTFIHSSVAEFLVARHAAAQLTASSGRDGDSATLSPLESRAMSPLMVDFFCTLAGADAALAWARAAGATPGTSQAGQANALAVARHLGADLAAAARLAGAKLSGQDLSGRNLSNADLAGADLTDTRIADADLSGANLTGARLDGAVLTRTTLAGATLAGASLVGARLAGCDLTGATLDGDWSRTALLGTAADSGAWETAPLDRAAVAGRDRATLTFAPPAASVTCVAAHPTDSDILAYAAGNAVVVADWPGGQVLRVLSGHIGPVHSVVFSPDDTRLASAGGDGTVRVWDAVTGVEQAQLTGHTGPVHSVAFSPDGSLLASAGEGGTVWVWVVATGANMVRLHGRIGLVHSVVFSPDGARLASGGDDGTVRVWDAVTGVEQTQLTGHIGPVHSVAFSPDGSLLASAGEGGTVRVWVVATGAKMVRPSGHTGPVRSVAFSVDGSFLASAGDDGTVRVWVVATGAEVVRLSGHTSPVRSVVFSAGGSLLISAGDDGTVRIWDLATSTEQARLTGDGDLVRPVAFSPDGARLASADRDGTVWVWDVTTGTRLIRITGHIGQVWSVHFSSDGAWLASAGDDGTVRVWDVATGTEQTRLSGHSGTVLSAVFSPDGAWLASAGDDGTVRVWDAATGTERTRFFGDTGWVRLVAFSPDGARLATAGSDHTVRVWDAVAGTEHARFTGHSSPVRSVAFSPDGALLASASGDDTVRVWRLRGLRRRPRMTISHSGPARSAAFSPDGARLATAGVDGTVRVWDAASGTQLSQLTGHIGQVLSAVFSAGGTRLASAGEDGTVRLWDGGAGTEKARFTGHGGRVWSVAFAADGSRLASAGADGTVAIWHATNGTELVRFSAHDGGWVTSVLFSRDGTRLASGGGDGTVGIWDPATGIQQARLSGHSGSVWSVAFAADGARLASAGSDGTVRVWDAATGAEQLQLTGHSDEVNAAVFSPDGTRIVTASDDGTARVWDAATGAEQLQLTGHSGPVYLVVFSPDGTRLATVSRDGTLRLWDAATGTQHAELAGRTGWLEAVAFSPDGTRLATGGADKTVRVWDAATGTQHAQLTGHTDWVRSVAFSPDGTRLASAGDDSTVRIWNVSHTWNVALVARQDPDMWAAFLPDGRYKLHGNPAGRAWWAVKLCRFEPGELDPYDPAIRRIPDYEPII